MILYCIIRLEKQKWVKDMYSSKDLKKEVYKLGEVAKFIGVEELEELIEKEKMAQFL